METKGGVKPRPAGGTTAAAQSSPKGHHRPVLQMSAKSGPPLEASETLQGNPLKQISSDKRELTNILHTLPCFPEVIASEACVAKLHSTS